MSCQFLGVQYAWYFERDDADGKVFHEEFTIPDPQSSKSSKKEQHRLVLMSIESTPRGVVPRLRDMKQNYGGMDDNVFRIIAKMMNANSNLTAQEEEMAYRCMVQMPPKSRFEMRDDAWIGTTEDGTEIDLLPFMHAPRLISARAGPACVLTSLGQDIVFMMADMDAD